MVTDTERRVIVLLIRSRLWKASHQMRLLTLDPKLGTMWIFRKLIKRQVVDELHHAPCCPANHYHNTRFVFQHCNCGAEKYSKE